jgi:uncharacterized protein with HEPN domain
MTQASRVADFIGHIDKAARDARAFVDGMCLEAFLSDRRTQQAGL